VPTKMVSLIAALQIADPSAKGKIYSPFPFHLV